MGAPPRCRIASVLPAPFTAGPLAAARLGTPVRRRGADIDRKGIRTWR